MVLHICIKHYLLLDAFQYAYVNYIYNCSELDAI